jgi:hypothetical protein
MITSPRQYEITRHRAGEARNALAEQRMSIRRASVPKPSW